MSGLCLTAGKVFAAIPLTSFTLVWTNPSDQLRWEEQWRIVKGELRLVEAKKRGDGRELQLDPVLTGSSDTAKQWLVISTGTGAPAYELCIEGRCRSLPNLLPGIEPNSSIELSVCPDERE